MGELPRVFAFAFVFVLLLGTNAPVLADEEPPSLASETAVVRSELETTLGRMQAVSRRVREHLRDARRRGTTRQIQCADEALSRSDIAYRAAREAAAESLAAYARSDPAAGAAMRVRVHELVEAQRLAARDGAACAPPAERVVTGTVVRVIVDPGIANPGSR